MDKKDKQPQQLKNGGFVTKEAQVANAIFRGLELDVSLEEVKAHDQMERDIVNAQLFGYPIGTPSAEIGRDIVLGHNPKPE